MDEPEAPESKPPSPNSLSQWTPDQVLTVIDKLHETIKDLIANSHQQTGWRQVAEVVMLVAILVAALILALHGRLDATFAGLLGTILGYFYGRGYGSGSKS